MHGWEFVAGFLNRPAKSAHDRLNVFAVKAVNVNQVINGIAVSQVHGCVFQMSSGFAGFCGGFDSGFAGDLASRSATRFSSS